ncbi:flagellin [Betaproteobacteria bacterium LSUCC0117]|nr:flagellin [Betaproteobacteria bacterium LSUCC0117]
MTVINTNVNALFAKNSITANARDLSTAMERLSTGSRINSAKDDAAGLAISTRMSAQSRGLSMAIRNANDGISLMQTSEGALGEVTDILQRMRELAVQSANGTNNASDRVALNDEVQQLKTEIERIATTTEFNSQKLLDGSFKNKVLQIGDKADQTLAVDFSSARLKDLSAVSGDAIFGARLNVQTNGTDVDAGDVLINGQAIAAIDVSADDIGDIIENINQNVDGVTASAFNEVVAKQTGDGKTSAGNLSITVTPLGSASSQTISIAASESMAELVANINNQASGLLTASVNDDGKLVLRNDTGASITIADASASTGYYDGGSGFKSASTTYQGFIRLEATDGAPVRVTRGDLGTNADLAVLGFMETTSDWNVGDDAYTVTGQALTTAGVNSAWGDTDIKINGVAIYDENYATTTFSGKLDAINRFSGETGVVASAYLDTTLSYTASANTGGVFINGKATSATTAGTTLAVFVGYVNAISDETGVTATAFGTGSIRFTGDNVQAMNITSTASIVGGNTSDNYYGGIRLNSIDDTPIAIELGDSVDSGVAGGSLINHGFLEANVGAADFEVNDAMSFGSSGSMTKLDVSTLSGATKAITTIDGAIEKVSSMRSQMGAMQNRLDSTVDNLSNVVANTQASRSRIQDTDYAAETTALAKSQIIQQAATAMLAQANQQAQSVLSLLQ